jgi:hypothetical protein
MRNKPTPLPEPERLATLAEVADHPPEPEPVAAVAEPAPAILAAIAAFKPSEPTRAFGAHLGRHAQTLLHNAEMSIGEGAYALRQLRDDAQGAVIRAHSNNDTGKAAAVADVHYLDSIIIQLKG